MILFTFVYDDNSVKKRKKIEVNEDLFFRIGQDDMSALDELYSMTERTMYAYAVSLTKDHEKSLDLVQDTYIKICSAAHLYKPMGKPLAWMFTIAKNLHYSNYKIDYKGKEVEDLTKFILDLMIDKEYLDKKNNYLLLSVYNKDELKADLKNTQLNDWIHNYLENNNIEPIILSQKLDKTSSLEKYAEKYNISINKMTFIRNLILLNPAFKIEDLVELNLKELISLSQNMDLEIEKIMDISDLDKIKNNVSIKQGRPDVKENMDLEDTNNQKLNMPVKEKNQEVDRDDEEKEDISDSSKSIISEEQARSIALSIANGEIVDFDFDDDDLEYEVEIEADNLEYEIKIDAVSGAVLKVDIDD